MTEQEYLDEMVAFVQADRPANRFFTIDYSQPGQQPQWEAAMYLGRGYSHPSARVYGEGDRWLRAQSRISFQTVLASLTARLSGVVKL